MRWTWLIIMAACGGSAEQGELDTSAEVDALFEVDTAVADSELDTEDTADTAPDVGPDTATDTGTDTAEVTPVCEDCDDQLACTEDGCGVDGLCRHEVRAGFCAISSTGGAPDPATGNNRCVTAGFGSQCQVCAPNVDPTRYTPLTGGPCDDGDPCTTGEECMNGVCRGGAPITCPEPAPCEVALGCAKNTGCAFEARPEGSVCGPGLVCVGSEGTPACVEGDPFPIGTLAFFDRASCPSGWALASSLTGRTPVAGPMDHVGTLRGDPLTSGEDRRHSHTFSGTAASDEASFVGIVGGGNGLSANTSQSVTAAEQGASTGLPYLQLLGCEKTAEPSPGTLPLALSIFSGAMCPVGTAVEIGWGRLIVATPAGGTSGASFGRATPPDGPTPPDATPHSHTLSGRIPTPSKGIALASGCCGGGYAASGGLRTNLTSTEATVLFPTVSLQQCELPTASSGSGETDAAPPGMVLFATGATCPSGWSVHIASQGRMLVGATLGGDVGLAVQTPLSDREDRTHTHAVTVTATLSQRNIAAANGPNNNGAAPGTVSATLPSAPATSGLAFVQRLACVKNTP